MRSGSDDFRTPFEFFARIAATLAVCPGIETALLCSSHFAALAPRSLTCFTPAQFGVDESPESDWADKWPRMLRGDACPPWDDFYRGVVAKFQPTIVFAWNKNALFAAACRAAGIAVVTLEYGSVRTPSGFRISVDPIGFGPESALATRAFAPDPAAADAGWLWAATHVMADALAMRSVMRRSHGRNEINACVLLQKEDDVNFLVWPAYESMWDFLQSTLSALSRESNLQISVRPHPAGLESYDQRIAQRFPTVTVERDGASYYERLCDYDCVFTLNSAAGLEALLCRIPTMTFAPSAYPCAFAAGRDGDISEFLRQVRSKAFWTDQRVQDVGQFTHRLVRHYSIPQELLTEPALYARLVQRWSNLPPAELEAWFEAEPPRLASETAACSDVLNQTQQSALRYQNSCRAAESRHVARQVEALSGALAGLQSELRSINGAGLDPVLRQIHAHIEALAEMTRQNEKRDHAIASVAAELHRQSRLIDELARRGDESGVQIRALLEQVHLQSRMLAEIWELLRPAESAAAPPANTQ
ncbi:MAG: hypothetical protein JNG88_01115 [Phycisphaerales bacterium]|nr:hypothetical protein [Phycisphaerales bacterium]